MRTRLISLVTSFLRLFFRNRPARPSAPRSILIIKPCCLGDVLLTTPLVAAIRQGFPDTQITYAVGRWAKPMIATNQHINATITLPDRWSVSTLLATARELRRYQFDVVFVPERTPVLTLLAWLARIPHRVGLDSAGRGFAYNYRVPFTSIVMHEADVYNQLAPAFGLPKPPHRLFFWTTPAAEIGATTLLAEHDLQDEVVIALHPGGGQNPGMTLHRKRWLPERWAAVADALAERYGAKIVLLGGPGDEAPVAAVAAAMQHQPLIFVQRWDWNVLAALLQRCALFLGHDTGMMHLAMAVDLPTVAVFGPSDPQIFGPYGDHGTYVWCPTYESPCFYEGSAPRDCPCAMQCMRNVDVADVLTAAERMLAVKHVRNV